LTSEIESALAALEALEKKRGRPGRHHARPVLVGLGELLLSGRPQDAESVKRRLEGLPAGVAGAWPVAVSDEIEMAGTEYVRSVDPRYLDHEKYDWDYTLEARERLADRLRAVRFLGIRIDESLLAGIERADRLLESRRPGWRANP
jgi:hypothetical protein